MNINSDIYEKIKENNNMITTSQVTSLGYSRALLTKYVKAGLLERDLLFDLFCDTEAQIRTEQFFNMNNEISTDKWLALKMITRDQSIHESLHIIYTNFSRPVAKSKKADESSLTYLKTKYTSHLWSIIFFRVPNIILSRKIFDGK